MSKKHGHHGGSWKVAYADFVTAMMALFLVLWLTAQDTKIKEAVERAFRNPFTTVTKESTGIIPSEQSQAVNTREGNFTSASALELIFLRRLNEDLLRSIPQEENEDQRSFKVEVTSEGLRLSVFDRAKRPVFDKDSAQFTEYGQWVFTTLAWIISDFKCQIELEGHTEKGYQPTRANYDAWELTTDRANAARRKLVQHGVKVQQVRKVAGFADTQPMAQMPPEGEVNRRVTVLLKVEAKANS